METLLLRKTTHGNLTLQSEEEAQYFSENESCNPTGAAYFPHCAKRLFLF